MSSPVAHPAGDGRGVPQRDVVHPQEVLQVLVLRRRADLPQPLELGQLAAALLSLLLLQRLLGQEAAQAALHALAHGRQRHDSAAGAAADAAAATHPAAVPARGRRRAAAAAAAARLGDLQGQEVNRFTPTVRREGEVGSRWRRVQRLRLAIKITASTCIH